MNTLSLCELLRVVAEAGYTVNLDFETPGFRLQNPVMPEVNSGNARILPVENGDGWQLSVQLSPSKIVGLRDAEAIEMALDGYAPEPQREYVDLGELEATA